MSVYTHPQDLIAAGHEGTFWGVSYWISHGGVSHPVRCNLMFVYSDESEADEAMAHFTTVSGATELLLTTGETLTVGDMFVVQYVVGNAFASGDTYDWEHTDWFEAFTVQKDGSLR